jgi:poly-gamma-glutamate synthesis protein (capsule biosynthesis protein)
MIQIIGVGDIMPGGLLNDKEGPCANEEILNVLLQGDIRCGTLECALGNEPTYDEAKVAKKDNDIYGNVIYAKDADIRRLKELHIDIVSLANNHFFDLGEKGAQHTIELLDKEGILHCGAGRNLKEAGAPVVLDLKGKKMAFLGFCDTEYKHVYMCTYATENTPGINPMREDYVISEIKRNAQLYDYVVVLAHWGTENTFYPNVSTDKMAKMMLKAGACLVLGSHPHCIQPIINTRKGSIVYSMGNFLFPERLIAPPKVTYYSEEPIDYSTLPVTDKYPIVDCVTLKTLPYWARVGQIVISQISNSCVVSDYRFSYLNKYNCVTLLDERKSKEAKKRIKLLFLLLKLGLYQPYMFIRRAFRAIQVRLR